MASHALRQAVFGLLTSSPVLQSLGYNGNTIMPNFTPDGPDAQRFMVLRWGNTTRGIGQVGRVLLSIYAYNREPDFAPITDALKEVKVLLPTLTGQKPAIDVAVLDVFYEGDTLDIFDDGYRAHARSTEHTITASGS